MRHQRGLIGGIGLYAALGAVVVIGGMGLWLKIQGDALDRCRTEYASFVATAKALGEQKQKEADAEKARLEKAKERADADAKRLVRELNATRERLHHERANRNVVPAASPTSSRPELSCFDRSELGAALQRFREGLVGIAQEGDQATLELNTAKAWAKDVAR